MAISERGNILLAFCERRILQQFYNNFIGYIWEEVVGGVFCPRLCWLLAVVSFYGPCSTLKVLDSGSSCFSVVALVTCLRIFEFIEPFTSERHFFLLCCHTILFLIL